MKKYISIFFVLIALFLNSCNTNDAGFYRNVFVNSDGLVTIETQPTYSVGDKIYLNASIPKFIVEEGQTTPLDIFKTTGGATQFNFSYIIEKQINSTDWEVVTVNDSELDIQNGLAQSGYYINSYCNYNSTEEKYQYRVGFPLMSTGNYRMYFNYNGGETGTVELRSISDKTNLILNITSNVTQLNGSGVYNFTVN